MHIIAKTDGGFIIEATKKDVEHILKATHGSCEIEKVQIGTKIPAIDYSTTITKVKDVGSSYPMKKIKEGYLELGEKIEELNKQLLETIK